MDSRRFIVLRGLPGSGKSTLAREAYPGATVVSADDFFAGEDGVYRFDGKRIREAHGQCLRRCVEALQRGDATVVVDNTNIEIEDAAPYMELGPAFGYDTELLTVVCDPAAAAARNTHAVPAEAVLRLGRRLEMVDRHLPRRWKARSIPAEGL